MQKIGLNCVLMSSLFLFGCDQNKPEATASNVAEHPTKVVKLIGKDNPPYSDLAEFAQEQLKKENIDLQIQYVNDSLMPNRVVNAKEADLNFFQHQSYLDSAASLNQWDLKVVSYTFNTIFGAYSPKYTSISTLPDKARVVIPSDTGNNGRALLLLQQAGLIQLKPNNEAKASRADIIANPKQLKITEVEQPMIPSVYRDSDLTLITGAYTAHAGVVPKKDALVTEKPDPYYTAVLVGNGESIQRPEVQRVKQIFESEEARQYILKNFSDYVTWER
jgi:D-methionine transport system substrate-binding protein